MKTYLFLSLFFTVLFSYGQWTYSNLSTSKWAGGATSLGSKAYFAGGTNIPETIFYSKIEIYDVKTKTWSTSDLSAGREFPAGIACGSKVFFAGGANLNGSVDIVDIYDTITQKWTVEHLSEPRNIVAAATKGNKVLFAGGFNNNIPSNVVDIYDIQTGQWSKDTLSMPRASMGVAVAGDLALFAGGFDMKNYTDRVDIYNFTSGKWTTDTLSAARALTGAAAVGNKVLIAGGMTDPQLSSSTTDLVEIYDVETGKWSTSKISLPRCFTEKTAITMGEKAFFTGGGKFTIFGADATFPATYNVIDIYDGKTGTWSVDHLTHELIDHSVAVVDSVLIVAGGWSRKEVKLYSTVEMFTENTSSSKPLDDQAFLVYPNPASDILTLATPNGLVINDVVIYNLAGQKVLQSKPISNQVKVPKLKSGVYFIVLKTGQMEIKKKLMIQ